MNWTWNGVAPHQFHCPQGYLAYETCLCTTSDQNDSHIVPNDNTHKPSSECSCFPSPIDRDEDGDLIWLHQERS